MENARTISIFGETKPDQFMEPNMEYPAIRSVLATELDGFTVIPYSRGDRVLREELTAQAVERPPGDPPDGRVFVCGCDVVRRPGDV
jgi:hypothetical protein